MSFLKFNHVFFGLMALAALSAFVLPPRWTDPGRTAVEGVFYPVSRPSRRLARWAYNRFAHDDVTDLRPDATIRQENDSLRQEVANLTYQLDALKVLNTDRQSLGQLRALCTPVPVIGGDSAGRDSLLLKGSSFSGLMEGMPVLYPGGLAGRIERVGVDGARVRLITDIGMHITGTIIRFAPDRNGQLTPLKLQCPDADVEGMGDGRMVIRMLTIRNVHDAPIAIGDGLAIHDYWVILHDSNWPMQVQGIRLGQLASITERKDAPGFAELHLARLPEMNRLMEVMVMTKQ